MKKFLVLLAILAAGMTGMGCEATRPVVSYPGLAAHPQGGTCVLREADHCFIGSVDDHPIEQYDVNILSPATYRQFRLPAGKHVLTVYFRQSRNFDIISGALRHVTIDVQPDRTYVLKANLNGADVAFGDTLSTVNWRPAVEDTQNGTVAGEATLSVQ